MIARYLLIDWPQFLAALVLLLTPGALFYGKKKTRYRDITRDLDGYWPRIFTHGLHAIDLARAALGTWLLIDSLQSVPNPHGFAKYAVLFTQGSIRILAVFLQTVVCKEPDHANAPFTFVVGLLLAGVSPLVGLFACALAIPLTMGLRLPAVFFPLVGLAHLGIGFWFKGKGAVLGLGFGAAAAMVPTLWSLLFRRDLVVAYRAKPMSDEDHHGPLR
jgi:hypothetical protein